MAPGTAKQPVLEGNDDEIPVNDTGAPVNARGRKLTSHVWAHMERDTLHGNSVKATCKYCQTVLTANSKSGTSHLSRHLEKCPRKINHDIKNYFISGDQLGNHNNNAPPLSLRNPAVNLEEVRRAIGIYVVAGAHPFSTCDEQGFRHMVSTMCPHFECISRHTLKRDILKHYEEEKRIIKEILLNAPGRVSFTTDNWRSEHTNDEFMCITAHWINSEWELEKRIVQFKALTPPFDGQSLSDEISLFLAEWKLDNKVMGFTVDNASYNDSMIGFLKSDLARKKSLVFGGEFFYVRCSCHIINLVVQAGLKLIDDVVVKIRSVVKHFKHSIPKRKKFYDVARTMFHLNTKKKLRGDNLIRWNSTFLMLDRFLYYKNVVDHIVGRDKDIRQFSLSNEEWNRVSDFHDFLKVFYDVTNTFSASKTPTSNLYFYGVWRIHKKLIDVSEKTSSLTIMAKDMEEKFEKYWSDYNLLLSCAAVLDPRSKSDKVEYYYGLLFGETYGKEVANNIKRTLVDTFEDYSGVASSSSSSFTNSSASTDNIATSSGDVELEEMGFKNFMEKRRSVANNKSELEMYLDERVEDCEALSYWKKNSSRFPNLARMARDILAIPISTVPSESAFSMSKKLITAWRASLGEKTIEALACYEDWLRDKGLSLGHNAYGDAFEFDENEEEENEEDELAT